MEKVLWFIMKNIRKIVSYLQSVILLLIGITTAINIINCIYIKIQFVLLEENQLLYIYSSLAQVIGAILGLTIASYSMIDSKMKVYAENDDTVEEYIDEGRRECYRCFLFIIVFCIFDIIFCLMTIATYSNNLNIYTPFLMTESIILFVFVLIEIFRFVMYLNPNEVSEKGEKDKKEIDLLYEKNNDDKLNSKDNLKATFSMFVTNYNQLEQTLIKLACKVINSEDSYYKIKIFDALDILLNGGIINGQVCSQIDEIRRYRNAIVHSCDDEKNINGYIYERTKDYLKLFSEVIECINDENKENKISNLKQYGEKNGFSETDRSIIEYINKKSCATISELAETSGRTRAAIRRRLELLQRYGIITRVRDGKEVYWHVNK